MFKNKKILFLSPHPDDIEFYCGGILSKLTEQGNDIMNVAFSLCTESIPDGFPEDILKMEFMQAMKMARVYKTELKEIPVRRFNEYRQDILEFMVKLNKEFQPDIVFIPSANDIHQDHEVIHKEALRAFRCSLLSYEIPLNTYKTEYNLIIELELKHIINKNEILSCYKSQKFRHYSNPDYTLNLAKLNGSLIKKDYAEIFKIIRWID